MVTAPHLSPPDTAAYLGLSDRTLARYRSQGIGPSYVRTPHKIIYRRADLDAWLQAHAVQPVRERQRQAGA